MSFDEEWAAARTTAAASVSMRLNQAAPGTGGQDLELNQDHIGAIGTEAHMLHSRLQTDGKHAAAATAEAAGALGKEGFASGAALTRLNSRWESQVKTLGAACAQISNGLNYSLSSHDKEEQRLYAEFTTSKLDEYLK
ncbi:hypothetical protein SLAV_23285 [Streptomyces lavendulae subsp. lavendulae]|uniref:Uncharacterized protein n=1 Tax=Streptomyces lavendulae subsp. lavendulae TaxID=58340 RepID=A0A2K8PI97_STRLA|nr:hypothetical protein [Streptomyces lavendulae]ATZ26466.1 hypothetical protein SLAV_23285 [Streptomyces lavendulae subsp. lavendulae]QUQ56294.1 hypothetical protein SLLC_21405 [Streptomyces lavendulae subsp. lavendulae]